MLSITLEFHGHDVPPLFRGDTGRQKSNFRDQLEILWTNLKL